MDETKCPKCKTGKVDWEDTVTWIYDGKELGLETYYEFPSELTMNYKAVCKCGCNFSAHYDMNFIGMEVDGKMVEDIPEIVPEVTVSEDISEIVPEIEPSVKKN